MAKPPKNQVGVPDVSRNNMPIILGGLAVVVALAIAAIVMVSAGGDDDATNPDVESFEWQPVTVEGSPLPKAVAESADTAVGVTAPTITGKTFTGETIKIAADGRPKAIGFYAHWCPHCQKELPLIVDWLAANKSKYDIDFYAVATGTEPTRPNFPPSRWFDDEDYPFTVMADSRTVDAATAYGLSSYPYFVFLDGANKVISRDSGELTMAQFEAHIQSAVNPAPLETAPPQ